MSSLCQWFFKAYGIQLVTVSPTNHKSLYSDWKVHPHIPVTGTFAKAKQVLEQKLKYIREKLQKFRNSRLALQSKDKEFHEYTVGQIVYMYYPRGNLLQTSSKKIKCEFVGPLAIYKCVSPSQLLFLSLDGYLYPFLIEETRIKSGFIPSARGNVSHLAGLKKVIRLQLQGVWK